METNDEARQAIADAYRSEYRKKSARTMTSPAGFIVQALEAFDDKMQQWHEEGSWKLPATMFSGSALIPVGLLVAVAASPLTTLGLVATAAFLTYRGFSAEKKLANEALERDIDNGTLTERYRKEILQPKIDALEFQKSHLPPAGAAGAEFAAAVTPAAIAVAAQPVPAAPAPTN